MAVLVLAEHSNAALNDVTAKTVAAAKAFGGDIDVLVAGHNAGPAAEAASKLVGVRKVIHADGASLANGLAESLEALVVPMMAGYDAFFAPATSIGKNVAPRIAAKLDVMQVSEVTAVHDASTFERSSAPIVAPIKRELTDEIWDTLLGDMTHAVDLETLEGTAKTAATYDLPDDKRNQLRALYLEKKAALA